MEGNGKQAQQRRRGEERIFTRAELERAVKRRLDEAERDAEAKLAAARQEGVAQGRLEAQREDETLRVEAAQAAALREAECARREQEITRRELRSEALEALREKGLSPKLAECLDYASKEACEASIERIEQVMREAIQQGVDQRIAAAGIPLRVAAGGQDRLTAHVRSAMGLGERH